MRGVYCDGTSIRLDRDRPEPEPRDGEVVLDVLRVGICETDLQLARGYMGFRGTLGHEFVGRLPDGRRATAEINNACHRCPTCRAGHPNHCPHRSVLGILDHDGAMADRVAVPERNLHLVPDTIGDDHAPLIEPLAAAFRVAEQVPLGPGIQVTVVGDGKLGLLCAWVARLEGATTTLVGKHPGKLALAGDRIRPVPLDRAPTLGRAADVVIDCTGSPTGLATALTLVRPTGTIVLKTTIAGPHELSLAPIVIDEVRLIGSRCGPFPRTIEALAIGAIDVSPLIGPTFPLDQAEAAFHAAAEPGAKKVLLEIVGER